LGGGIIKELHLISSDQIDATVFSKIVGEIHPYLTAVHLRKKQLGAQDIFITASKLIAQNVPHQKIIINDRVDVAIAVEAKGVQLAYHSLEANVVKSAFPKLKIGCSVHSAEEAKEMEKQGADYVLYGHVFPTASKPGKEARGLEALKEVVDSVQIPVIAIGGIKPENSAAVLKTGAAGIAVLSTILEAENPLEMTKSYVRALGGDV